MYLWDTDSCYYLPSFHLSLREEVSIDLIDVMRAGECLELRLHPPSLSVVSVILYPEHSLIGVGPTMGSQPRNFFQSVWIPFVGSPVAFTRGCLILCPISTPPTAILLQMHVSSLECAHCFSSLLLAISARLRVGAALGKVTCKSTESREKTVNSWHP